MILAAVTVASLAMHQCDALGQSQVRQAVVDVAGRTTRMQLRGLAAEGTVVFFDGRQERQMPRSQLVRFGHLAPLPSHSCLICKDGSRIVGELTQLTAESVTADTLWGSLRIPLDHVAAIVVRFPSAARTRDQLTRKLLNAKGTEDLFYLANGDQLRGNLLSSRTRKRRSERQLILSIQLPQAKSELSLDKVTAIRFNPRLIPFTPLQGEHTVIDARDGSHLFVKNWQTQGKTTKVQLGCGLSLVWQNRRLPAEVVCIQPMGRHVTYLSDLPSYGYGHTPYFQRKWKLGVDRSCAGTMLRSSRQMFLKGLGMHSYSRVAYNLRGRYRWFQAELALDRSCGKQGSVVYRVFLNDGQQWQAVLESGVIRGGTAPRTIRVDVRGAQQLALIVDFADRGDILDRANWLDARLIPKSTQK